MNNITTRDDGDVVRRVATNIFQTNNARFSGLLCVGNEVKVKVRVREWDLLGKNTSVSSYHPPVSIQRRLNNESRKPFDCPDIAVKVVSNRGYVQPRRWFVVVAGGVAVSKSPPPKGFIALVL